MKLNTNSILKAAALSLGLLAATFAGAQTKVTVAGAETVEAVSINNGGDVAVNYAVGGKASAGILTKNGDFETVQVLSNFGFEFRSINEGGSVLGVYTDPTGVPHAFLTKNGKVTVVGDLGWGWVDPIQVTNNETVIGTAHNGTGGFPFIWKNGEWSAIRIEKALHAYPAAVTNDGKVLVKATYEGGGKRSFIYDDGALTELTFGGRDFQIIKMNAQGQVLAYVYGDTTESMIWKDGVTSKVYVPGATNVYAWDINDNGSVVGVAFDDAWNSAGFVVRNGVPALLDWSIESADIPHIDLGVAISGNNQVIGVSWAKNDNFVFRKLK